MQFEVNVINAWAWRAAWRLNRSLSFFFFFCILWMALVSLTVSILFKWIENARRLLDCLLAPTSILWCCRVLFCHDGKMRKVLYSDFRGNQRFAGEQRHAWFSSFEKPFSTLPAAEESFLLRSPHTTMRRLRYFRSETGVHVRLRSYVHVPREKRINENAWTESDPRFIERSLPNDR